MVRQSGWYTMNPIDFDSNFNSIVMLLSQVLGKNPDTIKADNEFIGLIELEKTLGQN